MIGTAGDGDHGFRSDVDKLLGPSLDARRFPILAKALGTRKAPALRRELMDLFGALPRARAPRRSVRAMCRLAGPGYDQPVLVKNISATGVRLLVPSGAFLDLTRFTNMSLDVRIKSGARTLAVALVRRCGGDLRNTDLACRFVSPTADHQQIVAEIRSRFSQRLDCAT
ncbi:MAG: hypothetical protein QOI66_1889 [Myxococcales bacterium]|nr:hypothetical protein [Myxococcales bacterium]